MNIITLFCNIDDFFLRMRNGRQHIVYQKQHPRKPAERPRHLHPSEVMTILIAFHQSGYRMFKTLLRKTRLRLLARGVSTLGELL